MKQQVKKLEEDSVKQFQEDPKTILIKNLEADNKKLREDIAQEIKVIQEMKLEIDNKDELIRTLQS